MSSIQVSQIQAIPGFIYGSRYPSICAYITFENQDNEFQLISQLNDFLCQSGFNLTPIEKNHSFLDFILKTIHCIYSFVSWPIFEQGNYYLNDKFKEQNFRVLIPTLANRFSTSSDLLALLIKIASEIDATSSQELKRDFSELIKKMQSLKIKKSNIGRFMKAAHDLGIAFFEVPGSFVQYGYSKNSKRLDSSFTDETSVIAANIARNKITSNTLLRLAGIPVPNNYVISNLDTAKKMALKIGFPVVIKPFDLDGGIGVSPNINSLSMVEKSFLEAKALSKNISIEKHFFGRDYRLVVFKKELLWTIEKIPPSILGDGLSTAKDLIYLFNKKINELGQGALKKIEINEKIRSILNEQGVAESSIIEKNKRISLSKTSNISQGGIPLAVMDDRIHPDNKALVIRASEVLGLDLSGVDLIMPDIERSWLEVGAVICEVNAQPQLGRVTSANLYTKLLNSMVMKQGDILTIFVIGLENDGLITALEEFYIKNKLNVGFASSAVVKKNKKIICPKLLNIYRTTKVLALDKDIDVTIISIENLDTLSCGLAFHKPDLIIFSGKKIKPLDPADVLFSVESLIESFSVNFNNDLILIEGSDWADSSPNSLFQDLKIKTLSYAHLINFLSITLSEN